MTAFLFLWLFVLGTIFGSFLNVVVWRLPQGMSLSFPASHCPRCQHPIRWRHNIPLLGWCMLRGKCYDCGEPISVRYPLVEFLCGVGFLCPAWIPFLCYPCDLYSLTIYIYDVVVFMTLLAIGLIEMDGNRVPLKILIPWGLMAILVVALYYPFWMFPVYEMLFTLPAWVFLLAVGIRDTSNPVAWILVMLLLAIFPIGIPMLWVSAFITGIHHLSCPREERNRGVLPWSILLLPTCQLVYAFCLFGVTLSFAAWMTT
ncbi:MAG: prepilin peptidase [Planctomycetia bacterium]|nr:prepilin peptidase [Planctomycetia bacterium]